MEYNREDINLVKQYKSKNLSNKTILAIVNKQSKQKYTELDIEKMANYKEKPVNISTGYEDSRLYEAAAGFIMNPAKRKKAKNIFIISLLIFIAGLICLGFFVSWKPVIIIVSSIVGIVVIAALAIFLLFKCGLIEKFIDKYGF